MAADESNMYAAWLLQVANLMAGGLIVSLSIAAQRVNTTVLVLGMLATPVLYAGAYLLLRRSGRAERHMHEIRDNRGQRVTRYGFVTT
jgi:hypothetical protein